MTGFTYGASGCLSGKAFNQSFDSVKTTLQFFHFRSKADSAIMLIPSQMSALFGIDIKKNAGNGDDVFFQSFLEKSHAVIQWFG